jgi:uncharacterized protein YukE
MEQAWQGSAGAGFTAAPGQELDYLKSQADILSERLEEIRKRIDDLESGD